MILPHDEAASRTMVHDFCIKNKLDPPLLDFQARLPQKTMGQYSRSTKSDQLYSPTIKVDTRKCRFDDNSWSYPGYLIDSTILGTTAHELGHHVCHLRGWDDIRRRWYSVIMSAMDEPAVGVYATTQPIEDFAEAMRIFIINPSLLKVLAPKRADFIIGELHIIPIERRAWEEILEESPKHIQEVRKRL